MEEIKQKGVAGYTGYERKVDTSILKLTKKDRDDLFEFLKIFDHKKIK
jgi:hypothetical protein